MSFGYGTYSFEIASDAARLDSNLVLGLFSWSDTSAYKHREIDIEISRWGRPNSENMQFVVPPYDVAGNMRRFMLPLGNLPSIHRFTWAPERIDFQTIAGSDVVKQFAVERHIPAGDEHAHINLWSMNTGLSGDGVTEILVKSFKFEPLHSP